MSHAPIPCMFLGTAFYPLAAYRGLALANYGDGEVITLAPVEDRSMASHRHFMAVVKKAFENLPEGLSERYANPEHLRKNCLIRAGYRDETTISLSTHEDAARVASLMDGLDDYAIITVHGSSVTRWRAESQSLHSMGKDRFQASKDACLNILASMIGVDPTTLLAEADHST